MIGKCFVGHLPTVRGCRPRVQMPLFGYLAVVTPCLLALLLIVAEAFDAPVVQMAIAAPIRLPGSRVQVAASLPILTVREAPAPPVWALTSADYPTMARKNESIKQSAKKQPAKKMAGGQSKKAKRQVQPQRIGVRYIAHVMPKSHEAIGRVW